MKNIYIGILSLFLGSQMQVNNNEPPIKVSVELPDTIHGGQRDIPIILKVENTTSEEVSVRNPAHWGNAYPRIKQDGKDMPMIKVRINPEVFYEVIQIKGFETLNVKFDYTLDKLFNFGFHPSGKYDIYFEFCYETRPKLKRNKPFSEGKCVKSNVFTFCVQ